jgi:hypothetical protein
MMLARASADAYSSRALVRAHREGVTLADGLHLQVETMLSGPRCRPLEHACPQLEAAVLISKVLTFAVQDALRL